VITIPAILNTRPSKPTSVVPGIKKISRITSRKPISMIAEIIVIMSISGTVKVII
jgi:xanthine/uracil permease